MMKADAHFDPLEREFLALGLKANGHGSACGKRCAEKIVRIRVGRDLTDGIRAANRISDTPTSQPRPRA
jgi:hypothetical protein